MSGVADLFDDWHIRGGELTEAQLNTMVANAVAPQFEAINLTLTRYSMSRKIFQHYISSQNTRQWHVLLSSL